MPDKCPKCSAVLPSGALEGLCPACLLRQGPETGPPPDGVPFQPPAVEEVARLFPQLEILGFIGKGGMGAVYKARQPALDRLVALKILPPQAAGGPAFAERFTREARALARLNHPNIVAVHEFGQAGDSPFFIMEYVDGLTLRQLEQAGRLSPGGALQIVPQICEALQSAHDQGIVHRDIKPENILIDKKGRVKIADFGIAKIIGGDAGSPAMTATRHALGTPHYMAPEQVEQPQTVDHRADIYSVGVVFYEMLTGQLPLGRFAPPSRKVEIDVRLDEVVLRALEREPELRYQQAGEVKTQIDTISSTPGQAGKSAKAVPELSSDRRVFARQALWSLVVGVLGCPFLNALHASEDATMTFGAFCLVLGLVFGIVSWRERLGRIVAITVMALGTVSLVLGLIFSLIFYELRFRAGEETRNRENEARMQILEHQQANRMALRGSHGTPEAGASHPAVRAIPPQQGTNVANHGRVYLVGAVRTPGPIELLADEKLTVAKAIVRAGGFTDFADRSRVRLTRKDADGKTNMETFIVNVGDVFEKGKVELDLDIRADDLISIPERLIRF